MADIDKRGGYIPQDAHLENRTSKGGGPSGKRKGPVPTDTQLTKESRKLKDKDGNPIDRDIRILLNPKGNVVNVSCCYGGKTFEQLKAKGWTDDPAKISAAFKLQAEIELTRVNDKSLAEGDQETYERLVAESKAWAAKAKNKGK